MQWGIHSHRSKAGLSQFYRGLTRGGGLYLFNAGSSLHGLSPADFDYERLASGWSEEALTPGSLVYIADAADQTAYTPAASALEKTKDSAQPLEALVNSASRLSPTGVVYLELAAPGYNRAPSIVAAAGAKAGIVRPQAIAVYGAMSLAHLPATTQLAVKLAFAAGWTR